MEILIDSEEFRLISFDSGKKGETVCISGGVHGNESCGVKAIRKIEKEFLSNQILLKGKVLTLIANKKAIQLKKRCIDFDLNRAFGNPNAFGYESEIAKKITPFLQEIDFLLDLHSTSAFTKPFCAGILSTDHLEFFKMTGIDVYTHGWELHRGYSMLIDEINRFGGVGIIAECGKMDEKSTNHIAYQTIISLLEKIKFISVPEFKSTTKEYKIIRVKQIVKACSDNFSFVRNYKNLDMAKIDEVIAYDNNNPILYNYPFLIMMPNMQNIENGEEAFGIGIEEESIL